MEVSWYLRFSKADTVEILAALDARDSVYHAMTMHPDWTIYEEARDQDLLFTFQRKVPRFTKE